ncbi:hypothetical protein MKW98_003254 [Papaver atlanticum]|uniref:Uncharacterized protein n=1 Tax=Papaver atlanticum TaxID=357466 RepID=A0AAD4XRF6_9MAGN|nr:hypothetical protein MKW98_003254 [Papaver atlanticum]
MAAVESKKDLRLWDLILNVAIAGITQGGFSWVGVCLNCKTRVCDVVLLNWVSSKVSDTEWWKMRMRAGVQVVRYRLMIRYSGFHDGAKYMDKHEKFTARIYSQHRDMAIKRCKEIEEPVEDDLAGCKGSEDYEDEHTWCH